MPHSEDDLPALFRSLKPDKADLQNDAAISASEAEQKWPLLKNMSPVSRELPPALSADERLRWNNPDGAAKNTARKPALSLPGLGDKMAKSLGKMSTKIASVVTPQAAARAAPESPKVKQPDPTVHKASQSVVSAPPVALAQSPFAVLNMKLDDTVAGSTPASVELTPSLAAESGAAEPAQTEDSLAQVFSRLEGKKKPIKKPSAKSASFMGRLGKR